MSKKIYGIPVATPFNPENLKVNDVIRHGVQNLTEAQKTQARANIGAQPVGDYALNSAIPTVPSKLPSPYALTINGVTYDGSKEVSVVLEGGTSAKRVEVLEEIALSDRVSGDGVRPEYSLYYSLELVAGETYIVIWDGAEYECVAQDASVVSGGEYAVLLGNGDLEGLASNHEPFYVEQGDDETTIKSFYEGDHTISIYKYQTASGMGSADLNASEGEPGHVLNRTHWVEGGMVEVLAECQPTFDEDYSGFIIAEPLSATVDETYIVNWNGVEYPSTVYDGSIADMSGAVVLINDGIDMDTGDGMVFMIAVGAVAEGVSAVAMPYDGTTELTISIYQDGEVVHKLDPKFLPDGYPYAELEKANGLPETTVDTSSGQGFITTATDILPGGLFTVTYNGVEYECEAQTLDADGVPAALLGNGAMLGMLGKDEPFLAMFLPEEAVETDGVGVMVMPLDGATSVTLKVEGYNKIVHKINEEYLPDLGAPPTIDTTDYELGEIKVDATDPLIATLCDEDHAKMVKAKANGIVMLKVSLVVDGSFNIFNCPVSLISWAEECVGTCLLHDGTYLKVQLVMKELNLWRKTSLST